MRSGAFSVSPELWPTVGAALVIALALWLARWQVPRGDEKEARQALLEPRAAKNPVTLTGSVDSADPLVYRRVRAAGQWVARGQAFIDNQVPEGRAGYHGRTPLELSAIHDALLVNRGGI